MNPNEQMASTAGTAYSGLTAAQGMTGASGMPVHVPPGQGATPQRLEIGPRGYVQTEAATTATYTPLSDREAYVTGIWIDNATADDVIQLTVAGKQLANFLLDTGGNQDVVASLGVGFPGNRNLFSWHEKVMKRDLSYPVPNGQELTLTSLAGNNFDSIVEFKEVNKGTCKPSDINHFEGRHFRMPIWAEIAAATLINPETPFDTEFSPAWVPKLFSGVQIQAGYSANIWSINSTTGNNGGSTIDYLFAVVAGQRLWTRSPLAGIPDSASIQRFPPWQAMIDECAGLIHPAIHVAQGVTSTWGYGCTGTSGSADDLSAFRLLALVDVMQH